MNILVTSGVDASNLLIENVVRELYSRGHHLEVFARFTDPKSIRMFTAMGLPVKTETELTNDVISKFDIAFCAEGSFYNLRHANIYAFLYNHMLGTWATECGDFMFTMVRDRYLRHVEDCATMPIGIAKNDRPRAQSGPKKQILYIDAGHFPFGAKGKYQVANMLLDICRKFPDYDLVVKPRWLLKDSNQTHVSRLHLYNILEELTNCHLPDNLVLLQEHRDLQELIDESVSVVTTSVSCYFDAALRGKGCIVVDGLDSEKQYDTWHAFEIQFEDARRAGCCADYREVTDYLPEGLRCDQGYFLRQVPYTEGVSSRIADVMEYIYYKFIRHNKYPAIRQYDFETYQDELENYPPASFHELKQKRIKNAALSAAREFEFIQAELDYDGFYQNLDDTYRTCATTAEGFSRFLGEQGARRREVFIKNKDVLMADAIDQSFLLRALYDLGRKDEILELEKEKILCTGPYHYYLGLIYNKEGQESVAVEHFRLFLKEANARPFNKYWQEGARDIRRAYDAVFAKFDGWNIPPAEFAELCFSAFEQREAVETSYGSRKRAHGWLPKVAELLADTDPERALKCLQIYARGNYHYNIRERDEKIRALTRDINSLRSAKLYRLKERVKWFFRKLKGGIKCYQEHGWKYTAHRAKEHMHNYLGRFSAYKIYDLFNKQILDGFRAYSGIVDAYGEKTFVHVPAGGNGDVYLALEYYKAYIKKHYPDRTNVFASANYSCEALCDCFGVGNVKVLPLSQYNNLFHLYVFSDDVNIDILHHHVYLRHTGILQALEGIHGMNFMELLKAVVFDDLEPAEAQGKADAKATIEVFTANGLEPGKTVVLAPYANNVAPIPERYWKMLVRELWERGLSVCTNVYGEQEPIEGTVPVDLPLCDMEAFLNQAGRLVSRRSGFDDVTHNSTCKRVEVYPKKLYKRSLVVTTPECFAYVDDPIIVGMDNINECVEETLIQLGLIGGDNPNE